MPCSVPSCFAANADIAKVDVSKLGTEAIEKSAALVKAQYALLGGTDQVAKGTSLVEAIKKLLAAT